LYGILSGAGYCHDKGIIHRNLKADNILLTEDEEVKIADFSLSKRTHIPHVPYTPEVFFCNYNF
jgi:serine/threonine protein kinase